MAVEFSVISIGTLSHNRLWGEPAPVRTAHATTTLVADGERLILVDPSLPAQALEARFYERTGKRLADVTDVFCTCLRPVHRRSIMALCHADWWANKTEIETCLQAIQAAAGSAERLGGEDLDSARDALKIVKRFKPAPDKFSPQVNLYPLAGPTAGNAGLLLTPATANIIIAGDAALTAEHVLRGQVWQGCHDVKAAMESLTDLLEVADIIVPGHDNMMLSPQRYM